MIASTASSARATPSAPSHGMLPSDVRSAARGSRAPLEELPRARTAPVAKKQAFRRVRRGSDQAADES